MDKQLLNDTHFVTMMEKQLLNDWHFLTMMAKQLLNDWHFLIMMDKQLLHLSESSDSLDPNPELHNHITQGKQSRGKK